MHSHLNQDTRHGSTNLARVGGISLGAANVLNGSLLVNDGDLADFTVHLKEHLTLTSVLAQRTDSKELQNQDLALLQLDVELLTNLGLGKEEAGGEDREVTVLLNELAVVLKDLGVHDMRGNVALSDGDVVLLTQVLLDLSKVDRVEVKARALVKLATSAQGISSERLGESAVWLTHQALKEFQDGAREVELAGTSLDSLGVKTVGDHELGEITNNLGSRSDLDNVAKEIVGLLIGLLGLKPLGAETELRSLEHHVGELATGDFVLVDLGVGTSEMGLEWRVEEAELRPVGVESADLVNIQTRLEASTLKRGDDGVDAGLRSHARQAVSGSINSIGTSLGGSNHGGDTSTGGVVGVHVDRQVGVSLANGADEEGSSVGLENTSHILDTKNMNVEVHELVDKFEVVLEVVLLVGVEHVTAEADGTFNNTTSLVDSLDTNLELVNVVQGVKDTENIDTVLLGLLDELVDGIVGEGRVSNTVGATEEHLEGNVGNKLAHLAETVPRVLVEEAHGDVKSGTTPAFQTEQVGEGMAGLLGNVEQINSTDTSGKKRLVSITPSGIHEKTSLVLANGLGKGLGALLDDDVSPALLARLADVDLGTIRSDDLRNDDVALKLGLTNLTLDGAAVDGNVAEVGEQLLASVLAAKEIKERRGVVDEGSPAVALDEGGMGEQTGQEGNVGLDTTDTELNEGTENLSTGDFVGGAVAGTLDQHGIVEGCDDGTGKTVATVETNTGTAGSSVDLNLAGIGLKLLGRVFGGDTALNSETTSRDAVLGQAELSKGSASSDLDLSGNDVDAGNFFGNGVLDLDSGVDLNEVVAVLLVDKELGGTGIAVVDGLGELDSVGENGVSGLDGEILGGRNFDHLLVATLDGAITLVQMNNVSVVITKKLDLNVLGLVKEALDKDGTVTEGRLGLGGGTLEVLLETLGLADDTHTTATTAVGGLDDDGESILVGEGLDLLEAFDGTLGTRDDRDVSSDSELSGRDLVAKGVNDIRRGADKLKEAKCQYLENSALGRTMRLTMRPAFSTLRANSAFSERKP